MNATREGRPRRPVLSWLTGPVFPWSILILLFVYLVVFPWLTSFKTRVVVHNATGAHAYVVAVSPVTREVHPKWLSPGESSSLLVWSEAETIDGIEDDLVHVFAFASDGELMQHTAMTTSDSMRRDSPIEVTSSQPDRQPAQADQSEVEP